MAHKPKPPVQQKGKKREKSSRSTRTAQNPIPLDSAKLKQLYSTMLGCRILAERVRLLVEQGRLSHDVGVATGREAAEVGALIDLLADDCVAPGPGDLNVRFIRHMPLKAIFAQFAAQQAGRNGTSTLGQRAHASQLMIAPALTMEAQINLVTGVAWSLKQHGKPFVAVAFSNDASSSSINAVRFSAAHKLPIIHIIYNNGPGLGGSMAKFAESAQQPILPVFAVDGNDVVAVYRVAQEAIRRARQGHGPALIECQSCTWDMQGEIDSGDQQSSTVESEQSGDPVSRMETYLQRKRLWSSSWKQRLAERFSIQLNRAVKSFQHSRR